MSAATDLDQVLTSAQAAMAFALVNYMQFTDWLIGQFGRVPVSFEALQAQALQIGLLIDPERLPE